MAGSVEKPGFNKIKMTTEIKIFASDEKVTIAELEEIIAYIKKRNSSSKEISVLRISSLQHERTIKCGLH